MYTVLNPHISDFFATPLSFIYLKRRALKKYEYIIKNDALQNGEISFLFDGENSSIIPDKYFKILPATIRKQLIKIEIKKWKKVNNVAGNIQCYFDVNDAPASNTLFFLCYRNYKNKKQLTNTANHFKASIAHLTHYYAFPVEYTNAINAIKNIHIAADADVSNNAFFKQYFSWYNKQILIIPFAIADRFTITIPYYERENKAIATGTFHKLEVDVSANDPNCFEIKKQSITVHPMRRMLYENKENVQEYVDVFCKPFYEKNDTATNAKGANKMQATQSAYFSFDIVAKYNQFKFAVIGEESIVGLPGIGSFEAMGCGCVLIANAACYAGTGAEEGKDYLGYDSTIESLRETIKNNLDNTQLETISNNASNYVKMNFNKTKLQENFLKVVLALKEIKKTSY